MDTGHAPGLHDLGEGLYQIVLEKPSCHVYLIRGRRKNVLIDAGLPSAHAELADALGLAGLRVEDIHLILLTHEHNDHAGGAPCFAGTAVIAAHALAARKVVLQDEFVLMNQAFGSAVQDFQPDIALEGEASIELGDWSLRVIHTPGHTSGSVCFYEPRRRMLFSGDTLLAGGALGGVFASGNLSDYIGSLERLAMLRLDQVLPGHGKRSHAPGHDIAQGRERAERLMRDSRMLFQVVEARHHFHTLLRAARRLND